jgi:8-oxo-dGTP pyrophosphatase MutT (NUDIX family)
MNDSTLKHAILNRTEVFRCRIFRAFENTLSHAVTSNETQVYTIGFSDWVNVIPVTADGHIALVRQHRFGTDSITLETPGGAVDPLEKDLTMAALRELEEETGLTTSRILALPGMFPNPAIQGNRITYFLALDVAPQDERKHFPDAFEQIELTFLTIAEALQAVRTGRINHALAALGILMAEPYLTSRFSQSEGPPPR